MDKAFGRAATQELISGDGDVEPNTLMNEENQVVPSNDDGNLGPAFSSGEVMAMGVSDVNHQNVPLQDGGECTTETAHEDKQGVFDQTVMDTLLFCVFDRMLTLVVSSVIFGRITSNNCSSPFPTSFLKVR